MRYVPLCCAQCGHAIVCDGGLWRHQHLQGASCDWGQPYLRGAFSYRPRRLTFEYLEEAA